MYIYTRIYICYILGKYLIAWILVTSSTILLLLYLSHCFSCIYLGTSLSRGCFSRFPISPIVTILIFLIIFPLSSVLISLSLPKLPLLPMSLSDYLTLIRYPKITIMTVILPTLKHITHYGSSESATLLWHGLSLDPETQYLSHVVSRWQSRASGVPRQTSLFSHLLTLIWEIVSRLTSSHRIKC